MEMSPYNAYLLITKDGCENFGIAGLTTDNPLNVGLEAFMKKEETEIIEAKFKAKTQITLETGVQRNLNGSHMTIKAKSTMLVQKNQVEKFVLIDIKDNAKK